MTTCPGVPGGAHHRDPGQDLPFILDERQPGLHGAEVPARCRGKVDVLPPHLLRRLREPVVPFRAPDEVARGREAQGAAAIQGSADVVRVSVGDEDRVDVLGPIPGGPEVFRELPRGGRHRSSAKIHEDSVGSRLHQQKRIGGGNERASGPHSVQLQAHRRLWRARKQRRWRVVEGTVAHRQTREVTQSKPVGFRHRPPPDQHTPATRPEKEEPRGRLGVKRQPWPSSPRTRRSLRRGPDGPRPGSPSGSWQPGRSRT